MKLCRNAMPSRKLKKKCRCDKVGRNSNSDIMLILNSVPKCRYTLQVLIRYTLQVLCRYFDTLIGYRDSVLTLRHLGDHLFFINSPIMRCMAVSGDIALPSFFLKLLNSNLPDSACLYILLELQNPEGRSAIEVIVLFFP